MATGLSGTRRINVRLIHNGVQPGTPLTEPLRFGLQDSKGEVRHGVGQPDETLSFDLTLETKEGADGGRPVFRGAFTHGPPAGRFLYLSWKRDGEHEHPWGWRIKIPLSGIGWAEILAAEKPGKCLVADVTGRRPHASGAIDWRIAALKNS